jgi:hypothetical protein
VEVVEVVFLGLLPTRFSPSFNARTASDRLRIRFANRKSSIAVISASGTSITSFLAGGCTQESVRPAIEKVDPQMHDYAH